MLKTIAIIVGLILVVAIAAILILAATKPDSFLVQRSTSIKAPPEKIAALIEDLRRHTAWSPWEKVDPDMQRSYSGAEHGKGAIYAWDGNKNIGAGRIEITDSSPSRIVMKLDFARPFEAHNIAEFTLDPKGDSTIVTWAMHGPNAYIHKVMQTIFSMDKMVGTQFEIGLANLKAIAEQP